MVLLPDGTLPGPVGCPARFANRDVPPSSPRLPPRSAEADRKRHSVPFAELRLTATPQCRSHRRSQTRPRVVSISHVSFGA